MTTLLADAIRVYRQHMGFTERAIAPLSDDDFFRRPAPHVNPIAVIVKHVGGNLRSRWTDFLTTDGDKPDRNRDGEFLVETDTRESILATWESGWNALFVTLESLMPDDLDKVVTIRGEPHSVTLALQRNITHTAYHVGQIMYLARLWNPDAEYQTMPPTRRGSAG